ncbi:hypothetical protein ACB092_10G026400 [Castanea dentata]
MRTGGGLGPFIIKKKNTVFRLSLLCLVRQPWLFLLDRPLLCFLGRPLLTVDHRLRDLLMLGILLGSPTC